MSLLVTVKKQPRVVDGELVKVGESCRLPNALALALENKGLVSWPDEKVSFKAAAVKSAKRKKAAAKAEKKKGDR